MTEISLKTDVDLTARTAALFVQLASGYKSAISIKFGNKTANAKSIMSVLSLSLEKGSDLTVGADGSDEAEAARDIERYLTSAK